MSKLAEVVHTTRLAVPAGTITVTKKTDVAPEGEIITALEGYGTNTNPDCLWQEMWFTYRAVGVKTGTVYREGETTHWTIACGDRTTTCAVAFRMPAEDVKSTLTLWGKVVTLSSPLGQKAKKLAEVTVLTSPTPKPVPVALPFALAPVGLGALLTWLSRK